MSQTNNEATPEIVYDYAPPMSDLLRMGDVRGQAQWADYLALGLTEAHIPDLIRMALDEDLNEAMGDTTEVWAPLHAWRALAQLQAGAAAEPLLGLLWRVDERNDDWVGEDLPKAFGQIGQGALEPLARYLANPQHRLWARVAAAAGLMQIANYHPELRTDCVAALSRQLTHHTRQDPALNGCIITNLTDLQAVEAASIMEEAFAADTVDISIQGDWEDTQIRLGLLHERLTPKPNYHPLLDRIFAPFLQEKTASSQRSSPQKPQRSAGAKSKAKAKAKRKQQKEARKKQRKRK